MLHELWPARALARPKACGVPLATPPAFTRLFAGMQCGSKHAAARVEELGCGRVLSAQRDLTKSSEHCKRRCEASNYAAARFTPGVGSRMWYASWRTRCALSWHSPYDNAPGSLPSLDRATASVLQSPKEQEHLLISWGLCIKSSFQVARPASPRCGWEALL